MNTTLTLAERSVPRYTSYPTAPHFSAAVGPLQYAEWLGELSPAATLSLYLHVPFCKELCLYCGCHTKAVRQRAPIDAYAEKLKQEIDHAGERDRSRRVVHMHWGGGTPSILGPDALDLRLQTGQREFRPRRAASSMRSNSIPERSRRNSPPR